MGADGSMTYRFKKQKVKRLKVIYDSLRSIIKIRTFRLSHCCQKLVEGQLGVRLMMDALRTLLLHSALCWAGVHNNKIIKFVFTILETMKTPY